MKYQLIQEPNKNYSALEQILVNRGIPHENIEHFLNVSQEDLNDPLMFGADVVKSGAKTLLKNVVLGKDILIIVDADADGFTSSAILINYLHDLFPAYVENHVKYFLHSGKQHGLNDCIDYALSNDFGLVCCPDSSSNDYKEHRLLKEHSIDCLVLDHHDADKVDENAIIINNQLSDYPNKDLSGAGVVWQFCRYIDTLQGGTSKYAEEYIDLAALGCCADMMDTRSLETRYILNEGFKNVKNPFFVYMSEKNMYSMGGIINYMGVAFYIAPYINCIVRSGTLEEKTLIFKSMLKHEAFKEVPSTKRGHKQGEMEKLVVQAVRVATNVKARQTKSQNAGMNLLDDLIQKNKMLDHKVLLFLLEPGAIDRNIAGLAANKEMAKYQRPVCVLTKYDNNGTVLYQGSARGCDKTGVTDFKGICLESGKVSQAEGHPGAFGITIKEECVEDFIQKTDELLKDTSDEARYYVDYIFQPYNIDGEKILEIAGLSDLYGKSVDESLVAIEHIKISAENVVIYHKRTDTIKISIPNTNVVLMKFNATEEDCKRLQEDIKGYIELNIVGKCNANEFCGNVTPQIFIEDYEITDSNEYFF